ncbi:signal peptidase I [Sphingobacterium spiritivorum]|uniref:signal peptidase I n=1 Tax=Sphingobacterium spiritivorum TaxID=258 RepID=UPI003DA6C26A
MWYIIFGITALLSIYGIWRLFEKAGEQGWKAIIPFYREYVMAQRTARPTWTVLLLLVPIVNVFVFYGIWFDFIKSFGKRRFWEHAAVVLVPFIILPVWGHDDQVKYLGAYNTAEFKKRYPYTKSFAREWADAIVFAVIAASLIRGFLIEAYMIPTGSMERSLLVGDFLFVSKLNYGPRIPITPLAFPFAHHTMPVTGGKAYSEWIQVPYKRLPGFQDIKRNDVVVFNYPMEADAPYNRPIDKRENYIKRLVGMPGDKVAMKNKRLLINGEPAFSNEDMQHGYLVFTDGSGLDQKQLIRKRYEATDSFIEPYLLHITPEESEDVKKWAHVEQVISFQNQNSAFPHIDKWDWTFDNFGPVVVPSKGWTVQLDSMTMPLYERAIRVYEGNTLQEKKDGIYINGAKATSYTFQMNYYWMMGDNRDNSEDSRGWGFVPEDHIVGKALFVWLSWDKDGSFLSKIRWNRIFKGIK